MATRHGVQVTEASVADGRFRATCSCTCGWTGDVETSQEVTTLAAAAEARVDHLSDAHPDQAPNGFFRPRAAARYRHPRSLSVAVPEGKRWLRHAACACGWTSTVRGPSVAATTRSARAAHQSHVNLQTGRAPSRDWVVLAGIVLVVAALVIGMAAAVIATSGGDPKDLGTLFG